MQAEEMLIRAFLMRATVAAMGRPSITAYTRWDLIGVRSFIRMEITSTPGARRKAVSALTGARTIETALLLKATFTMKEQGRVWLRLLTHPLTRRPSTKQRLFPVEILLDDGNELKARAKIFSFRLTLIAPAVSKRISTTMRILSMSISWTAFVSALASRFRGEEECVLPTKTIQLWFRVSHSHRRTEPTIS